MRHSAPFAPRSPTVLLLSFMPAAPVGAGGYVALRRPALAIDRSQPRRALAGRRRQSRRGRYEYYFGATGGGIWKTTDAGADAGGPCPTRQIKTSSVGAHPDRRRRIPTSCTSGWGRRSCAATSSRATASTRRPTPARRGRTWASRRPRRSRASASIRRIPTSCTSPRSAIPMAPNPERGVFRSKDGGKAWERVLFRDDKTGAVDLVMDPKNPDVLYADALGGVPHAALALERRPRQRPVQERPTAARRGPS